MISRDCLTREDMGQSCSGMSGPCPECRESCRDNCHGDEPCVDRCCNLCCQFCLDGCCLICPDDCSYTLCFTCTTIADSCAAVLTIEQPRSTQKPREGRWSNKFTFTFSHLADAFIQSDLHCIQVTVSTFYQILLSLGIEPMILALLTPCSTS